MSDRVEVLTIPFDVGRLSLNLRIHYHERDRRAKIAKTLAFHAWVNAGRPKFNRKVVADIVVRRGRRLDNDNIISACKSLVDGTFKGCVTPDDGPDWLEIGTVTQVSGKVYKGAESVSFLIRTAP